MHSLRIAANTAALALLCAGCTSKAPPPAPIAIVAADAGAKAGAETARDAPRAAHLAAVSRGDTPRFVAWSDGSMVVGGAVFVYRAGDEGDLERIGDAASYLPLVPENDDEMAGYDVPDATFRARILGPAASPIVASVPSSFAWNGRAWAAVATPPTPEHEESDDLEHVSPGLLVSPPPRMSFWAAHRLRDGRILALGKIDRSTTTLLGKEGEPSVVVPLDADGADYCEVPAAQDHKTYAVCHSRSASKDHLTVHQLAGDHWEKVVIPDSVELSGRLAIADDGALWFGEPHAVVRLTSTGRIERFELPTPDASLARATYGSYTMPMASSAKSGGFDSYRQWSSLSIRAQTELSIPSHVDVIRPRPNGRAWIVARDDQSNNYVFHVGTRPPRPITLGSPEDERNEVRNARPIRTWVGHCPQLFVTLAHESASGAFAGERAWSRSGEIDEVIKPGLARDKNQGALERAAIVEGRLGGRRVAGVVLWRTVPEVTEGAIEAAATALVKRFAENPASPPDVTCTLPVLEKAQPLGASR